MSALLCSRVRAYDRTIGIRLREPGRLTGRPGHNDRSGAGTGSACGTGRASRCRASQSAVGSHAEPGQTAHIDAGGRPLSR